MSAFNMMNALSALMAVMSPNTGDSRNPVIFIALAIVAVALIILSIVLNKSKKDKK